MSMCLHLHLQWLRVPQRSLHMSMCSAVPLATMSACPGGKGVFVFRSPLVDILYMSAAPPAMFSLFCHLLDSVSTCSFRVHWPVQMPVLQ